MAAYQTEFRLLVDYGQGFEHETTESTALAIRERIKEYRANCPQYPVKWRRVRVVSDEGRETARGVLRACGIAMGADFHALSSDIVESLLVHADRLKYRKPKCANGSRGRYFHSLMQRRAK